MPRWRVRSGTRAGFTLVELGAVVAVAGSVGVVLTPVTGSLQAASRDARSAEVHRGLSKRQTMYAGDHDGYFAGVNSSGSVYNRFSLTGAGNPNVPKVFGDTTGDTPVSVSDWISPIVGDVAGLPANRAQRVAALFDRFGDPTADRDIDVIYGSGLLVTDAADFEALVNGPGIRQSSFLQPLAFAQYGPGVPTVTRDVKGAYLQYAFVVAPGAVATPSAGYVPTIDHVGTSPSAKVMFADGTRYYTPDFGLNFDISDGVGIPFASPFTTDGPISALSAAYARLNGDDSTNRDLSFRKKGGAGLYASMYDGSVRFMTREQAWTDPTPWYPTGSRWNGGRATPESAAWVKQNLPGGVIF